MRAQVAATRRSFRGSARQLVVVLVASLALASTVGTASASDAHPKQLEMERLVMCTTCGRSLDVSTGPSAEREKSFIRKEIKAGRTKQRILDDVVAEHGGDRTVLSVPSPKSGVGSIAWAGPLVAVLVLLGVGVVTTRGWRRQAAGAGATADAATVEAPSRQEPAPEVRATDSQ